MFWTVVAYFGGVVLLFDTVWPFLVARYGYQYGRGAVFNLTMYALAGGLAVPSVPDAMLTGAAVALVDGVVGSVLVTQITGPHAEPGLPPRRLVPSLVLTLLTGAAAGGLGRVLVGIVERSR